MKVSGARTADTTVSGFRAIAWVVLLAFTLQSFITQVHIHGVFAASGSPVVAKTQAQTSNQVPSKHSAVDCPFCQAIMRAGAFSMPILSGLVLTVTWALMAAPHQLREPS